jgi:acyl-CoA synthetase (AMP-forming)/AMP-acid ligase II
VPIVESRFVITTLARRGLLTPGSPVRVARQLRELRQWGFSLAGELRSAAARDPDRIALVDELAGPLTYRHLDHQVRAVARSLASTAGVRAGDRVGILCRNHAGFVHALLAATTLGADAVLVNTGLSAGQVAAVAEEQALRALVFDEEFTELLAGVPLQVHRIVADVPPRRATTTLAGMIESPPSGELAPPEAAGRTIVLTSGTTGTPRGARRRTPSSFAPLASLISRIPWHVGDRLHVAAPLFHTWGLSGLQVAFALRATVVLMRRFDPITALGAVAAQDCSSLIAVPVMLQRMLDVPAAARPTTPRLRIVAVSGSALAGGLATRFMDAFGDVLYNLYGSTEASWVSIATPPELRAAPGCAGRPPRGTRLAIVDQYGNRLPANTVGRIFVGNEMLFEGYTGGGGRESMGGGLIATGDLGHLTPQGLLYVDGREDDMVVSGGENVHPSVVEDLIAALPQVREVAVVGVPDREWGQRLAAFVALRTGEWLDADAVREYVRVHLARYSVPRDVHFVDALPRNATGKVVTRDLPI